MSKLLKSKVLVGALIVAGLVFAMGAVVPVADAQVSCSIFSTLRQGSAGADVVCLQQKLGITADGKFGPITRSAVMQFQAQNGLTVDGVVGPMTRAALMGSVVVNPPDAPSLPAGCMAGYAYSVITGQPCTPTAGLPAGCMPGYAFSVTTGQPCVPGAGLPPGCTSIAGYSPITGQRCDGSTTGGTPDNGGPLQGGAGSINVTQTSVDTMREVIEGRTEKVLGFRVEADDSDVRLSSLRISLKNTDNDSDDDPDSYLERIEVWMDDDRIGSVDADNLSENRDVYSRSITLDSSAIVREGASNRETFYIVFKALRNIDSADMDTARWSVDVDSVRYTDATGANITSSTSVGVSGITFTDLAGAGEVRMRVSLGSDNPDEGSIKVNEFSTTSDVTLLEFDLEAEATDMSVEAVSINIDSTLSNLNDILSELRLMRGSTTIADYSGPFDADMSQRIRFDLYDDLDIDEGDEETLRVVARILRQSGNFTDGATLRVSLATPFGTYLEAEDENGDDIENFSGSAVGYEQTLLVSGATVSYVSSTSNQVDQNGQVRDFVLVFDVTAVGKNITVDRTVLDDNNNEGIQFTVEGSGTNTASASLSSNASLSGNTYTVFEGQTRRFTLTTTVTTTVTGQKRIVLEEVDGVLVTGRIESVSATVIQ